MSEMFEIQINTDGSLVSFHHVPEHLRGGRPAKLISRT